MRRQQDDRDEGRVPFHDFRGRHGTDGLRRGNYVGDVPSRTMGCHHFRTCDSDDRVSPIRTTLAYSFSRSGMATDDLEELTKKVVKWSLAAFLVTVFLLVLVLILSSL